MARPRKRICLQDGLPLYLNELIRSRMVIPGEKTSQPIVWQAVGKPGRVAWGLINADLRDKKCARIRILMVPSVDQTIDLVAEERNLGGVQWYFRCPVRGTRASILWKLPGAEKFCSLQSLDGRAAYHSQFVGEGRRAQIGRRRIRSRLGGNGNGPCDWYLPPPKPKWMRWPTYWRHIDKYLEYDGTVLNALAKLSAKLA